MDKFESLIRMIKSENFTVEMSLQYYIKNLNNLEVLQELANKLYQNPDHSYQFLTQLCQICLKYDCKPLFRFLLDKSAESITFYQKVLWLMNSFGTGGPNRPKNKEKVEYLERCIEMSMVNGERREDSMPNQNDLQSDLQNLDIEQIKNQLQKKFQQKEARSNYNYTLQKFISNLIKLSSQLFNVKFESRDQTLREMMKHYDNYIKQQRIKYKEMTTNQVQSRLYEGILFPFRPVSQNNANSQLIVGIISQECQCFNTRKRVPYKIVVETIDIQELETKNPNYNEKDLLSQQEMQLFDQLKLMAINVDQDNNYSILNEKVVDVETAFAKKIDKYQGFQKFAKEVQNDEKFSKSKLLQFLSFKKKSQKVKETNHNNFAQQLQDYQQVNINKDWKQQVSPNFIYQRKLVIRKKQFEQLFPQDLRLISMKRSFIIEKAKRKTKRSRSLKEVDLKAQTQFLSQLQKDNYNNKELSRKIENIMGFLNMSNLERQNEEYDYNEEQIQMIRKKYKQQMVQDIQKEENELEQDYCQFDPWIINWNLKKQQLKKQSAYQGFDSFDIKQYIVKGGDDLRQEVIIMQMIEKMQQIFQENSLKIYLKPYQIIVTSSQSGLLEFIPDSMSIDSIKKKIQGNNKSLSYFYKNVFGSNFEEAQKNFVESLAGYSLVCYLLQVKDRHNGNILIDSNGHIVHIDFGFVLCLGPGGIIFETAPFKLTNEYVELMGGKDSDMFKYFEMLLFSGFNALRKHVDYFVNIVEIMGYQSDLPCFQRFDQNEFKGRFMQNCTDKEVRYMVYLLECMSHIKGLIDASINNWKTNQYDGFQKRSNGILP